MRIGAGQIATLVEEIAALGLDMSRVTLGLDDRGAYVSDRLTVSRCASLAEMRDRAVEMASAETPEDVAQVPADLSARGLQGWVSAIRLTALGQDAGSTGRAAFLALARKNLLYAAFVLRKAKAQADFCRVEANKLPDLVATVTD